MNQYQKRARDYMDAQISQLQDGLENLQMRSTQPDEMGDLYNGMLKHSVSFEIRHMEHLKEDLMEILSSDEG